MFARLVIYILPKGKNPVFFCPDHREHTKNALNSRSEMNEEK